MSRNYIFRIQTNDKQTDRLTVNMLGKGHYKWTLRGDVYTARKEASGVWTVCVNDAHTDADYVSLKDCIARCFGITHKDVQSVAV